MVNALKEEGIKAYRSIDLFPPTKEYTREEVQNKVSEKNIPAVMFITITNIWETQKTYTTPKSSKITGSGDSVYYNEYGGQTYTYEKPNADIEFKILDIKHMAYSWIGEVTAAGNAYSEMDDILFKASEGITEKLKEDGKI